MDRTAAEWCRLRGTPRRRFSIVFSYIYIEAADPIQAQSSTSKASRRLFFGSGLLSPCRTKSMVKKAVTTNSAA